MNMMLIKRLAIPVLAAVVLYGCSGDAAQKVDLTSNRILWNTHNLEDYQFTLHRACFCLPRGEIVMVVKEGELDSAFFKESGEYLTEEELEYLPTTVEELFDVVDDAIMQDPHRLEVTYNETYGYPETIDVDFEEQIADDEFVYTVTEFM